MIVRVSLNAHNYRYEVGVMNRVALCKAAHAQRSARRVGVKLRHSQLHVNSASVPVPLNRQQQAPASTTCSVRYLAHNDIANPLGVPAERGHPPG